MNTPSCPNCGQMLPDPAASACPLCGAPLWEGGGQTAGGGYEEAGGGLPPAGGWIPPEPPNSVPFEDRSMPFFERFFRTVRMAFTDPVRLFSGLASGDIGAPLLYGLIIQTIAIFFSLLWQVALSGFGMMAETTPVREFAFTAGFTVLFMFFSPVIALIAMFLQAGIFHLCLLLFGDGQRGFAVTFRAVAYGNTPALLNVIPICGGIVGGIWAIVLVIMAAKSGHGTEVWRAVLAWFLPLVLCCCLVAIAMLAVPGFVAAAGR